jgi:MFS family permease
MFEIVSTTINAFLSALTQLGSSLVAALPNVFAAIIFIIVGYIVGWLLKKLVVHLLKSAHLDDFMSEQHLVGSIWNKKISELAGSIAKWYVFFVFLQQAVELVQLSTLNQVLGFWINFALLFLAALVVMIMGLIVARYVRNVIELSKNPVRKISGLVIELTIVYIAIVMSIRIIGLPAGMLESAFLIAFAGIILALSIAMGLGFGLALKDEAKVIIKELRKKN